MTQLMITGPSLSAILQREPMQHEEEWRILPSFRIGSVARVVDEVAEQKITAICLFPDFEAGQGMLWGYKLGDAGNVFHPENDLMMVVSLSD